MIYDVPGTRTQFGRAVSTAVRAAMGARRLSAANLAAHAGIGPTSLSRSLSDQRPFTADEIEILVGALVDLGALNDIPVVAFLVDAVARYGDQATSDLERESARRAVD